ncbi:MAG: hypothetical protein IPN76_19090 [Saprospiraceae bacterium]|nr:hypothetical protein [Saprospiraceae bacterium]
MSLRFSGIFKQPDAGIAPMPTWKQLLPSPVKIAYHLTKERLRDIKSGAYFKFVKPSLAFLPHSIELVQPIVPNGLAAQQTTEFSAGRRFPSIPSRCGPIRFFHFGKRLAIQRQRWDSKKAGTS